jgi:hypothetical protein
MSHTEQLIARIEALSKATDRATSTLSAQILGSGARFAELKAGKTITLAIYERALVKLSEMEAAAKRAKAA